MATGKDRIISPEESENTDDVMSIAGEGGASPIVETTEQVRQGHTGNHVRYILALSFAGAALMFAIVMLVVLR